MGATNSVQSSQGDISIIIQEEMPEIVAASWMMWTLGVHQLVTRPMVWRYVSNHITDPPPQLLLFPVLSARMVIILRFIPENAGIYQLPGSTSMTLTVSSSMSKGWEEHSWRWKMDILYLEVVAVGHRCTYKGCYPELQGSEDYRLADCNTLMRFKFS